MKKIIQSGVLCLAFCGTASQAQTFESGSFTDASVLTQAGSSSSEIYGVSFGNSSSEPVDGFVFGADPALGGTAPVTDNYSATASNTFLSGGGTSGNSNFDTVLSAANYGTPDPATVVLGGLTEGLTYDVLFLDADTRTAPAGRTFEVTDDGNSSMSQIYAFAAGTPDLGGYILDTFTASGTSETVSVSGAGQLNALLVTQAPEPATYVLFMAGLLVLAARFRRRLV
jgi:hypothetical protein